MLDRVRLIYLTINDECKLAVTFEFICHSILCDRCELKFQCFTQRGALELEIDNPPSRDTLPGWLMKQTHNTVYIKGSKKFNELKWKAKPPYFAESSGLDKTANF